MSYDGITEETNIRERLAGLAGDRIFDNSPDDDSVPRSTTGKIRPYIVLSIGVPFQDPNGDRSMADGEEDVPHIMASVVGIFAGDRESLNSLYKAVASKLVGWCPNEGNSSDLKLIAAINGTRGATTSRPKILSKTLAVRSTVNLATG